ncbi:MAG: ABC transporter ATP-binding protein [candidate division NC10 bacterium]|nr:ABC transporter ATP-binding protein [candidate division NC10 bacterium]
MSDFRRLLGYALVHKGKMCVAIVAMLLVAVLSAISIGTIQPILDLVLSPKGAPSFISLPKALQDHLGSVINSLTWIQEADKLTVVIAICGILLILLIVQGALTYLHKFLMSYVAEHVMMDVRNDLYAVVHTLSLGFFSRRSTGELMARLTLDVNLMGETVILTFGHALREPFYILSFGILLFLLHWQLALFCLIGLPLLFFPIAEFGKKIRRRSLEVQERRAELNSILQEALTGIRIVKAFLGEEYEERRFTRKNREAFGAAVRIARVNAFSSPFLQVLGGIGILGIVIFGSYSVLRQILTLGEFMVFLAALLSIFHPIKRLGGLNNMIQRGMAGVRRVFELMDTKPDLLEAPDAVSLPAVRGDVAFRGVSFAYDGAAPVLDGVSLEVRSGELVAIVGSSGAGKSTLVNLISRFYDPIAGRVEVDGTDVRRVTFRSLREQIGIVTQETILFDDTVHNNIAYGQWGVESDRVREAARIAHATEFIERLPQGYETCVGERGVRLSGGEKQRIAIARAVLRDAPILILDEATSALDAESERLVQGALDNLMRDRTTFIIAHRLSTILRADKILVLEQGRIVESGTHQELLEARGVYYRLYQKQFEGLELGGTES